MTHKQQINAHTAGLRPQSSQEDLSQLHRSHRRILLDQYRRQVILRGYQAEYKACDYDANEEEKEEKSRAQESEYRTSASIVFSCTQTPRTHAKKSHLEQLLQIPLQRTEGTAVYCGASS